ncbi:hypothetical protein ACEPAI_9204 [Sanghuangporus weigelae]
MGVQFINQNATYVCILDKNLFIYADISSPIFIHAPTSGIGFATAQLLVQHGAKKVYLAARNPNKAAQCIKRIQDSLAKSSSSSSNESVTVKSGGEVLFRQNIKHDGRKVRAVTKEDIINAILMTADIPVPVSYFSPFVFTSTLSPLLKKTAAEPNADVRIINVASDRHRLLPDGFHFKSKEDFNVNYGNSMMQSLN